MGRRKQGAGNLTKIEKFVLRALMRLGENAYGIAVRTEIEALGNIVSLAAVYFALERMERLGYVRSRMGAPDSERGGKAKRYFEITGKGADTLHESEVLAIGAGVASRGHVVGGAG